MTVRIGATSRRLQGVTQRLHRMTIQMVGARRTRLDRASARLGALSPLAVLSRGYALVYGADGAFLRSAENTDAGETFVSVWRMGHWRRE